MHVHASRQPCVHAAARNVRHALCGCCLPRAADALFRLPFRAAEVKEREAYMILSQFKSVATIRISVQGEYWERLPQLHGPNLRPY